MDASALKRKALEFLEAAREGQPAEQLQAFFTAGARHHNVYFPAGIKALTEAMVTAAEEQPDHSLDVKNVVAEGDTVAVHSHFKQGPADRGAAVTHIFRFEGDRIAEFWDFGQEVPEDMPNADGMF